MATSQTFWLHADHLQTPCLKIVLIFDVHLTILAMCWDLIGTSQIVQQQNININNKHV